MENLTSAYWFNVREKYPYGGIVFVHFLSKICNV